MSSTPVTAGLVAALAPLGAKYHVAFVVAYSDDAASATVTVHLRPKDGAKVEGRDLQIVGTLAEVDEEIVTRLPGAVSALVRHASSLESLAADLAAEEQAAREKAEAEKKKKAGASAEKKPEAPKPAKGKADPKKPAEPAAPSTAESSGLRFGVPASALKSPLAQQWLQVKEKVGADTLVLLRVGDFYEAFGDDAALTSKALNITLTHRNDLPMAGVPFHAIDKMADQLVAAKLKVALVDEAKTTLLPATSTGPEPAEASAREGKTAAELAILELGDDDPAL